MPFFCVLGIFIYIPGLEGTVLCYFLVFMICEKKIILFLKMLIISDFMAIFHVFRHFFRLFAAYKSQFLSKILSGVFMICETKCNVLFLKILIILNFMGILSSRRSPSQLGVVHDFFSFFFMILIYSNMFLFLQFLNIFFNFFVIFSEQSNYSY